MSSLSSASQIPDSLDQVAAIIPSIPYGQIAIGGFVAVIVLVVLLVLCIRAALRSSLSKARKAMALACVVLWGILFAGGEMTLSCLGAAGMVEGSAAFFVACLATTFASGVFCLASRLRDVAKLPSREPSTQASARSRVARVVLALLICLPAPFVAALVALLCLELPSNASGIASIGDPYLYVEYLVLLGLAGAVWLFCQRRGGALVVVPALSLVYGVAEVFVEQFKHAAIMPSDIAALDTGLAVAGNYSYTLSPMMLVCIALFALFAAYASRLGDPIAPVLAWARARFEGTRAHGRTLADVLVAFASCILGVALASFTFSYAYGIDWADEGIELNTFSTSETFHEFGLVPAFLYSMQLQEVDPPAGYTTGQAARLQTQFARTYDALEGTSPSRVAAVEQYEQLHPNVVVIMNESFSDLSFLDGLTVGYKGPTWFKNSQAYAKGKLNVSVYGGGTCNTEFEMLAETALSYVGPGLNPYVMYDMTNANSALDAFENEGYATTAIHPQIRTNWKRSSVYPALGFDAFYDETDFTDDALRHRGMIADAATYDMVLDILRANDDPQFVWDLTMANHGWYDSGELASSSSRRYSFDGLLDPYATDCVNEYIASLALSDSEIAEFIEELQAFEEPTVVVFFGDHQPAFTDWFTGTVFWDTPELERKQLAYQSDYAIWANYDIAGWSGQTYDAPMNAGQLMSYAKNLCGAPLTDYEKAQLISRRWSISSNAFGWMDELGQWHEIAQAQDAEDTYDRALAILKDAQAAGDVTSMTALSGGEIDERLEDDCVIFDAMRWVSYMNFLEKVQG